MDDDWTRGVERRLNDLEKQLAVDQVHQRNVELRLKGIEDALKWIVRLLIGGILTAALAYALQGGLAV